MVCHMKRFYGMFKVFISIISDSLKIKGEACYTCQSDVSKIDDGKSCGNDILFSIYIIYIIQFESFFSVFSVEKNPIYSRMPCIPITSFAKVPLWKHQIPYWIEFHWPVSDKMRLKIWSKCVWIPPNSMGKIHKEFGVVVYLMKEWNFHYEYSKTPKCDWHLN